MRTMEVRMAAFDREGNTTLGHDDVNVIVHIYKTVTEGGAWYVATLDDLGSEVAYGLGMDEEEALRNASEKYRETADEELMGLGDPFEKVLKEGANSN